MDAPGSTDPVAEPAEEDRATSGSQESERHHQVPGSIKNQTAESQGGSSWSLWKILEFSEEGVVPR